MGSNISDQQITSQIDVLNEDFRRMNADASNTPLSFQPVASDIEIEFILAKRDPEGLSTNGINRINGERSNWFLVDNYELKTLSNWPSEDYMNIWVVSLGDNFLGYAQFPVSDIGGLESASNSAITDGIVVDYRAFGSVDKYPPADLDSRYNLGRTATHEVGHYMGLRHIWGDGGCGTDDFCADTPASNSDNGGLGVCTFPGPTRCGSADMFQNYMDFTNDVCMNLFTEDQKTRIRTVMDNSPRRASLISSLGGQDPVTFSNDLGIRSIISPNANSCDATVIPTLELRNYGSNTISSAEVEILVNGISQGSTLVSLNLESLEIANVDLPAINLDRLVTNEVEFNINTVNGISDANESNNNLNIAVSVPEEFDGPVASNFDEIPPNWTIENDDGLITWELRSAPNGEPGNQALFVEFYNHENQGDLDFFTSPILDFTLAASTLTFDVAYAQFPGVDFESLRVIVTENCRNPLIEGEVVFEKVGSELSTAASTSGFFTPDGADEWRTETVDLSSFLGKDNIRISFVSRNDFGNNVYIDNVNIGADQVIISSPSVVSGNTSPELFATIINLGGTTLTELDITYAVDDQDSVNSVVNTEIIAGGFYEFVDQLPTLEIGTHQLYFDVETTDINGDTTNISKSLFFQINNNTDLVPFKESFTSENSNWVVGNPDNEISWVINEGVASIDLSMYEAIGEKDWLAGPIIDLTNANNATLNFDYSYSHESQKNDGLAVLVSNDNGDSYSSTSFDNRGSELKSGVFLDARTTTEYRNISIPLDTYLGESEIRIAFVSTNDNGDPIFVDNIQVFTTDLFLDAENAIFPNPTVNGKFNVRFTLDQRELVKVALFDALGHSVLETELPNTLNQTYTFDIANQAQGVYFIQVSGESFSYVRRVLKGD